MTLEVHSEQGLKGTIERTPTGLRGSDHLMQRLADQAMGNAKGNLDEAWEHLLSLNNGYAWTVET